MKSTPQEIVVFFVFLIKIIFLRKKNRSLKPVPHKVITKHSRRKLPLILLTHYQGYFHALYRNMSMSKNYRLRIFLRSGRMLAGLTESSSMPMRTNSFVRDISPFYLPVICYLYSTALLFRGASYIKEAQNACSKEKADTTIPQRLFRSLEPQISCIYQPACADRTYSPCPFCIYGIKYKHNSNRRSPVF